MKAHKNYKSKVTTNSREYKINTGNYEPYWDEGFRYHKPKGIRKWKTKRLLMYQVRMYKTWKHNRVNQFKDKSLSK